MFSGEDVFFGKRIRKLNLRKGNSEEPIRPEPRLRKLVKDQTPEFASDIPIDGHIWCYLNDVKVDKIKEIERKYCCALVFSEVLSCIKVCTSSIESEKFDVAKAKKRLNDATEAFAEIFQEVVAWDVKEEMWKIPPGLCEEREQELINAGREMNFVLVPTKVYRVIGPTSKYLEVTERLQRMFKDDGSNWTRFQLKDEPVANSHSIQVQPPQKEWNDGNRSPSVDKARDHLTKEKGKLSKTLRFKTPNGISISVAQGNVIHQSVDAIVNTANSYLRVGGGVTEAISEAAGEELNKECADYIQKHNLLELTCVMHTTAGRLRPKIQHVIHAVGPRNTRQTSDEQLYKDVKQTVNNCLAYANAFMKIKSIAIPAIGSDSSGIFGVPLEIVARSSFDAVMKFDKEFEGKSEGRALQDINFINTDEHTFTLMRNIFAELVAKKFGSFVDTEILDNQYHNINNDGLGLEAQTRKLVDEFTDPKTLPCKHNLQPKDEPVANSLDSKVQPEQLEWESSVSPSQSVEKTGGHVTEEKGKSSASLQFTTSGGIRVRVAQGNLVHQSVDAIVNPANSNLNHGSGAAEAISKAAGEELNRECRDFIRKYHHLGLTYATHTTAGRLKPNIKFVIHAVGPRKTHQTSNDELYNDVKHTVYNCLAYANTHVKIKSIAIPAISSGIFGVPLEIVARSSFDALMKFDGEFKGRSKYRTLQEVNFVNIDKPTFTFMKNSFAEFNTKIISSSVNPTKSHVSQRELLDNYASAWRRRRVEMEPDENSFAQAIAAALRNDFEKENCSCEEVEGRIEYEINTNRKYYKKFQMDKYGDAVVKWFKVFDHFMDNSDCEWDMILSAAANVFEVEIFLIQLAEENAIIERSFIPRSGPKDKRKIYLAYYHDGCSHFDPLVLNCDSANVKSDHFPAHNSYGSHANAENGLSSAGSSSSDRLKPSSASGMSKDHGREGFENISGEEVADMPQMHMPNETKTDKPSGDEEDKLCIICMDAFTDPVTSDCKHKFCRQCIDDCFSKHQPKCPSCGRVFGTLHGNQPKGTMHHSENSFTRVPGFLDCGAIEITYHFPNGVQGAEHPNPGQRYKGTTRTAYLPANREGREILQLLRKAFDAQLVFTIGRSNTTGQENVVIWNEVPHKTSIHGQYGYPDPTYLKRVREELAAKGIQ